MNKNINKNYLKSYRIKKKKKKECENRINY